MSATGIGAAVRRKEDFRFITGQGQYTDDVVRPGETRAAFVRSPHARAKIKSIDVSAAKKMPGVVDVLTGADLANDKIGNLICGWMIHSKDGTPMKMAPHPALASGNVNCVGDAVAVVIGETLAAGARWRREGQGRLRGVAVGDRSGQGEVGSANPRGGAEEHHLRMVARRRQGNGSGLCRRLARHQARHRQQPPGAECDRAARGARRIRRRHRQPHVMEYLAEPACGAPRHRRLRRHGAGAQIARDRARRRRRLRLQDFHLSGGGRLPMGRAQSAPAGEMGRGAFGILRHRRARPRPRHPCGAGARRQRQDPGAEGQDHRQSRRLYVDLLVLGADLSLRHAAVGPIRHPIDLLRGGCCLYQHRAGGRLSRRRASRGDLRGRAAGRSRGAPDGHRAGGNPQAQLHQVVPAPDAGDHGL